MIRNKKLRAAAAFLALVILALALMPAGPALAVSQSEIDALEEQRDELKAQREAMQAGIDELKNQQAGVLEHLAGLLEQQLYPAVVLRIDGMENDPQRLASALGQVLGGASLPAPVRVGSVGFPAGHWRQYAQALAGPFATLTPVAVRLGYPLIHI